MDKEELDKLRKEVNEKRIKALKMAKLFIIILLLMIFVWPIVEIIIYIVLINKNIEIEISEISGVGFLIIEVVVFAIGARRAALYNREIKVYRKYFKNYYVPNSLKEIFTDVKYEPEMGIPRNELKETGVINTGNRYHTEDYISAKYKNISFKQADVEIEKAVEDNYYTIFRGKWMIFEFNKKFTANIHVIQKGFGALKTINPFQKEEKKYKKIKTESEEFNNKFTIYAQDEHEAFYIITPAFIEKIQRLDSLNMETFIFCFIDNKLHIGLNNYKDSFEVGDISKPIDEEAVHKEVLKDIKEITQFVDELDLDNDLFKH